MDNIFVCPYCKGALDAQGDKFCCRSCGKAWPKVRGIPDFRILRDKYWGEYAQDKMNALLDRCREIGWHPALKEFFLAQDPEYFEYILDQGRANWHYLIPLKAQARILDAGCGWGTLSFSLRRSYGEVVAFDNVPQRLEFIDLRRKSENIDGLVPACGQINHLPFADDSFDLVVLNGVLEWIPLIESSDPYLAQLEALKEVRRVLKPGGYLYLAIENRWSAINFLGLKDTHSGLRFAPLLPRFLADIYSRALRGKDFREYTHTLIELRRMLKKSGFSEAIFYAPVPTYRRFYYLFPIEDAGCTDFFLKHLFHPYRRLQRFFAAVVRFPFAARLIKYFIPDFSAIARK